MTEALPAKPYQPRVGDLVRGSVVGRVVGLDADNDDSLPGVSLQLANGKILQLLLAGLADMTWEQLSEPEPDWEVGAVALDDNDVAWVFIDAGGGGPLWRRVKGGPLTHRANITGLRPAKITPE